MSAMDEASSHRQACGFSPKAHKENIYNIHIKFNASHSMRDNVPPHAHTFLCGLMIQKNSAEYTPFYEYEKMIGDYFGEYRGKCLNECDAFTDTTPTLENMAEKFFGDIEKLLKDQPDYKLCTLELGDSPLNSVVISGKSLFIDGEECLYPQESLNKVLAYRQIGRF